MRNKLISGLAGAAFSFASGLAFAADIPVKASPPAPAPVYNWTGWYAGVNAGASMGNVKTDFNVAPLVFFVSATSTSIRTPGFAGSNTESPSGFIGGGQIGYNWQYSPLIVVGLEADFQGALEKDHNTLTGPDTGLGGPAVLDYQTKIDWFGTVRARIGYVWGDGQVLSYVTGGLAYGKVDLEGTNRPLTNTAVLFSPTETFGLSHVNTGWTLGYGTEGRLATPGWTWKVESLYIDLGTLDAAAPGFFFTTRGNFPDTLTGGGITTHTHFTDWILRGGLNYQFH